MQRVNFPIISTKLYNCFCVKLVEGQKASMTTPRIFGMHALSEKIHRSGNRKHFHTCIQPPKWEIEYMKDK